jgi:hypothetical protein
MDAIMKKMMFVFAVTGFCAVACTVWPCSGLWAEDGDISVRVGVDRATLTIGDPVEYTLTVRRLPEVEIVSSLPAPDSSVFRVRKIEDIRQEDGGMIIEGKKFTLATYRLGEFVLDPVTVRYKTQDGETKSAVTNPLYLRVQSIDAGAEKTDIRGIKTVRQIPKAKTFLYLLVGLAFLLTAIFLFMFFISRRQRLMVGPAIPDLSPEDEALMRLTRLFESDWLRKGKVREYFFSLSEIMKSFLDRRTGIPAAEATTYEILRMLREKDTAPAQLGRVRDLMEAADYVKFAKWIPEPAQIMTMNRAAKQIVEDFRRGPMEADDDVR